MGHNPLGLPKTVGNTYLHMILNSSKISYELAMKMIWLGSLQHELYYRITLGRLKTSALKEVCHPEHLSKGKPQLEYSNLKVLRGNKVYFSKV